MDINTRHWRKLDVRIPTGIAQHRLAVINDTMYCVGGFYDDDSGPSNDVCCVRLKSQTLS